jgi:hypothetical protein
MAIERWPEQIFVCVVSASGVVGERRTDFWLRCS